MEDPLFVRTEKGPTLVCGQVSLYPSDDPIEYARRKARVFSPQPRSLVFVPSVGLGHGFLELLARLPDSSAILCVEADQRIMALAVAQGLPADPRLSIVRTADLSAVADTLARMGVARFRRVVEVPLCAGYRLYPQLYADIRRLLEAEIATYWRNRLTLIAMGSLQVRNLLENLALLPDSGDFSALSTRLPVVVAGAGPSFEESIAVLRPLRARFTLVAVDTALPLLAAESLTPDLVVALEAQSANLQDFLPWQGRETPLACELSAHPTVARLFRGRLFFFSSAFAPLRLFDRLAGAGLLPSEFPPLGSVGVAAVHAALHLTTGNVFLTGLDFGFPGSRTHARGTPRHLEAFLRATRLHAVGQDAFRAIVARPRLQEVDKHGGTIETDHVLKSYRDSLRREIGESADRVRDIGATGLDLGVRFISVRELAEMLSAEAGTGNGLVAVGLPRFSRNAVEGFLEGEAELLARAARATRDAIVTGASGGGCAELLRAVDYAWVHFPDEPDLASPGRSFLARVLVAIEYYAQRLQRLRPALRGTNG